MPLYLGQAREASAGTTGESREERLTRAANLLGEARQILAEENAAPIEYLDDLWTLGQYVVRQVEDSNGA